ncbi:MAG: ABC transporter permease [Lachnospiraceae bacterium]|nr:ABC transporter permease [Lachnospiraceae bacterium]
MKRNPLNKRIPRELRKNAGKYIGIFVILLAVIVLGSSFMATMDSAVIAIEENDEECKIEDGQFEVAQPLDEEIFAKLESLDIYKDEKGNSNKNDALPYTINAVENYYCVDDSFDKDATLYVFNEREELNLPSLFEGTLPAKSDEIAIERLFASKRDIKVNDKVKVNGYEYKVTGIIALPDYNSLFKNNQDLLMNVTHFGVSVVTKEGFEKFSKDTLVYRYSYEILDENGEKPEEVELKDQRQLAADIQKMLMVEGVELKNYLIAEDNQAITFLREDMGKDGPVMQVFIYLLIMVIAFVFAVLTSNTIEAEAAVIGTLRASGYKKSEIVLHYLSPTIIIALLSSVVGNLLGYTVMLEPFKELYYGTYSIAPIDIRFNLEAFITTTILPVVIMIIINWTMLYGKLSLSPLKFLRKDLSKRKAKKAIKLPNVSFIARFRMRVLLQNKVSYLILFVGIFISSFLLMFGIGMEPLFDHYVEEVNDALPYDYQYILKAPYEEDKGEKIQTYSLKTWYELGQTDITVSFMGISKDSEFFKDVPLWEDAKNDKEQLKGITISLPLAQKMGWKEGDEVVFKDEYYDKEHKMIVKNVYDYKGSLTVFMEMDSLNELLGYEEGAFNSYLSNEELDIPDEYLAKSITRDDMTQSITQMLDSFKGVFRILNVASVGIYMILMYILTKTVIEKNALAISFMKVFGYDSKEIGKLYLNATTITVLVSLLVCIPLELLCFKAILVYVSSMIEGYIPFYLPKGVCATIILIGIVAYFAINALHIRKVKRIPMSEALKNRE